MIGGGKFFSRKESTLMKPKGSTERHQTLSSRGWGLGTRLGKFRGGCKSFSGFSPLGDSSVDTRAILQMRVTLFGMDS